MRDRLIELLYEAEGQVNNDIPSVEQIADYLLANGVIVQIEGEWIAKKEMYRTPSAKNYYCSNCEKFAIHDTFMGVSRTTKYCPNCGAHMKGGAE